MERGQCLQQMVLEQWTSTCQKKTNLDTDLALVMKINSRWITELNVKCSTLRMLEANIGENLDDLGFVNDFSATTPRAGFMKKELIS